ncbi:hypothetical protein N7450_005395 [Penicillium hetheringtonii]|uniref:Uncharacterized protein n=1 Tax=Penicillium hetheringtonii TaxID=911720 RepID=A0AAD6DRS7_9EURO|nr:hypothetical protein N7450_005395 [Penicillium hetheringtonii]
MIKILDVQTGTRLQTLEGHNRPVNSVAFSPDTRHIAPRSDGKAIETWNTQTGAWLQILGVGSSVSSLLINAGNLAPLYSPFIEPL